MSFHQICNHLLPLTLLTISLPFIHHTHAHLSTQTSHPKHNCAAFGARPMDRRQMLQTAVVTSSILSPLPSNALHQDALNTNQEIKEITSYKTYGVIPDATQKLNPRIKTIKNQDFLNQFSHKNMKGGVLWLGEHHNSESDHNLQAGLIQALHDKRSKSKYVSSKPLSIGLEQVQIQFQPILDQFIDGKISEERMLHYVQWERRWFWSYAKYRPVFQLARELKIPLIALNVNSEDMNLVEKNGLPGLSKKQLSSYIHDRVGFAEYGQSESFKTYVNYVILPSYDIHKRMGLLQTTMTGETLENEMSFRNFFSIRILWDETMAKTAYQWTKENPGGVMVGLVGADHVKFSKGIPGRYARIAGGNYDNVSVMLNPTLIDSKPAGSVTYIKEADSAQYPDKLTLQLQYLKDGVNKGLQDAYSPQSTGGVLPIADYILVSKKGNS